MKAACVAVAVGVMVFSAAIALQARAGLQLGTDTRRPPAPSVTDQGQRRALVDRYCVTCHSERTKAGSFVLANVDLSHIGANAPMWEKVVKKLRGRLMPPSGMPRPDDATYEAFTAWIEGELDTFAAAHPNPGRPETFRRLNRTEYQNAIRDLLALDIDVSGLLPGDDAAFGFDNIGGVARLSPALVESYLTAARRISAMAMGTPLTATNGQEYRARGGQQSDRIEGLPLGTRGGTLLRHLFPQDAEYSFKIEMGGTTVMTEPHTMEFTIDGVWIREFTVERLGSPRETLLFGEKKVIFDVRVPVSAGFHEIGATFYRRAPAVTESVRQPFETATLINPVVSVVTISDPIAPVGAGDTPSRRRVLICQPNVPAEDVACATKILSVLARRAFRRPVVDADLASLRAFYEEGRAGGGGFEAGIESALRRLLVSPRFIFRIEGAHAAQAPATRAGAAPQRVSDVELASRLSLFLWSSIPDDRLLDLAEQGRLRQPAVLEREVRRMLADRRSEALTANFASQWLQLRKLDSARPGADYGKNFDGTLRDGLRRETELFVDSIVREDRPIIELLTADYTFLNERVARHYGIRDVQGMHFRRITLPGEQPAPRHSRSRQHSHSDLAG